MTVNKVSTYSLFQSTIKDINRVQNDLTEAQIQLSSGNKSQDFAGIADQSQQYLSLDATLARINRYLNNNKVIESRIDTTNTVLDQVIGNITSLQSLLSQRLSGVSNSDAFEVQVEGIWETLVGQLNTNVAGQYIFSGSKVNSPAVDADTFPSLNEYGVPDSDYYLGSTQDLVVRPQDNSTLTYNVRADADAFQKIFAGLSMARDGNAGNNNTVLKDAYDLIQQGLQGVVAIQATVNANKVAIGETNKNHETLKLYWQGLQESIGNTDVLSVSTEVAVNQGILQASFQAFAKINSLRLSDYLK